MLRIHNSLTGRKEAFRPIHAGRGRHVRLRHDGLRLLPRRACALLCGVRRGPPLAALSRLSRHLRAQHHRHRRQDHPARGRERRADRCADARASSPRCTRTSRRSASSRPTTSRAPPSTLPAIIAMIATPDRDAATPTSARTAMCCTRSRSSPTTDSSRASAWRTCAPARASRSTTPSAIRSTSCCGSAPSRASRPGTRPGARAGRAGTSSARRCPTALLGTHFDIHGGGMDLKFPHHENEIAQSCAACDGAVRERLDAQRLRQRRRREDVEVARQLLHGARACCRACAIRRCCAPSCSRAITAGRSITARCSCEQADAALTRLYTALRG